MNGINDVSLLSFKDILNNEKRSSKEVLEGLMMDEIYTKIEEIDEYTNGIKPGDFVVFAGERLSGKTSLILLTAYELITKQNKNVALFSFAERKEHIGSVFLGFDSKVSPYENQKGKLDNEDRAFIKKSVQKLSSNEHLFFQNFNILSPEFIESILARLSIDEEIKIDMIIIDSMDDLEANLNDRKETVSLQLAQLAKKLKIPIIVTTKVNRISFKGTYPKLKFHQIPNFKYLKSATNLVFAVEQDEVTDTLLVKGILLLPL